jgi:antitoxin FitA
MATITIRDVDDETGERLRRRAASHHRSVEEEVRHILKEVLARDEQPFDDLGAPLLARFAALGGVELELPERGPPRRPPDFERSFIPSGGPSGND